MSSRSFSRTSRRAAALALLGMSLTSACVMRVAWPRHQVEVEVVTSGSPDAAIEALALVYDAIELIPCEEDEQGAVARLSQWLLPTAQAHGPTTPIRQGVPHVVDLRSDEVTRVAEFEPPPGAYCALKLDFGPADGDAPGLQENQHMRGLSVSMSASSGEVLRAQSAARMDHTFHFSHPWRFGTEDDQLAVLRITLDRDLLLQALNDPGAVEDAERAGRLLLARLPQSLDYAILDESP